jgi:hypothetical protein
VYQAGLDLTLGRASALAYRLVDPTLNRARIQAIVVVMTAAVETPVAHVGEVRPNGPTSVLVDGPLTDVRILQSAAA